MLENPSPRPQRGRPRSGTAQSAAERMQRSRARRKAAGLRVESRWVSALPATPYFSTHRLTEIRSLAMHALMARKIDHDPMLLEIPKRNLARWRSRAEGEPPNWLTEWERVLERPWPQVSAFITQDTETATRLRQSTPFAGVLTPAERSRIYDAFRA
jgi:hypothetical protein